MTVGKLTAGLIGDSTFLASPSGIGGDTLISGSRTHTSAAEGFHGVGQKGTARPRTKIRNPEGMESRAMSMAG